MEGDDQALVLEAKDVQIRHLRVVVKKLTREQRIQTWALGLLRTVYRSWADYTLVRCVQREESAARTQGKLERPSSVTDDHSTARLAQECEELRTKVADLEDELANAHDLDQGGSGAASERRLQEAQERERQLRRQLLVKDEQLSHAKDLLAQLEKGPAPSEHSSRLPKAAQHFVGSKPTTVGFNNDDGPRSRGGTTAPPPMATQPPRENVPPNGLRRTVSFERRVAFTLASGARARSVFIGKGGVLMPVDGAQRRGA